MSALSALRVLPREVLARCLEFLSFDQALEAKQVSKEVRSAARRALIQRWRPIKFVAEQGVELMQATVTGGVNGTPVSAAALQTFRAAWELDPGLVMLEINHWPRGSLASRFLAKVEPTIDGLSRIIAACERTYRTLKEFRFLVAWSARVGRPLSLFPDYDNDTTGEEDIEQGVYIQSSDEDDSFGCELIGLGLGAWADPKLAANFVFDLVNRWQDPVFVDLSDYEMWSWDWQDRSKAIFMTAAEEILDRENEWTGAGPPSDDDDDAEEGDSTDAEYYV